MSSDLSNLGSNYGQGGPSLSPPTSGSSGVPTGTGVGAAGKTGVSGGVGVKGQSLADSITQASLTYGTTLTSEEMNSSPPPGDPAPPAALKGQNSPPIPPEDPKNPGGQGNPYFAPNPIAILSAATYLFFSMMEKAGLAMAQAVNKGMSGAAAESQSIAKAQIAAGQQQANAAIAQAISGAFQAAAGAFSLGLMGKGLHSGMTSGSDDVEAAKSEFSDVEKELQSVTSNFEKTKTNYEEQTSALADLQTELKSTKASTKPVDPKETAELEVKISNQQKVVKDSRKDMDNAHDDLIKSQEKWQSAKNDLSQAKSAQYQDLNQMGQWAQAISTTTQGIGQGFTSYMQSQANIEQAVQEAAQTVEQTELQNINKATDAASQSFQSTMDTMNGMLQNLDKAVDATAQANNMRG